ncbi:MAG: hypothetical protein ACTSRA_01115 [Promethearchaeota archaeon]
MMAIKLPLESFIKILIQISTAIIIGYITTILFRNWWYSRNDRGKREPIRFYLFLTVFFWLSALISAIALNMFEPARERINPFQRLNLIVICIGLMNVSGLQLIIHLYQVEYLYYFPWFFYIGSLIYYSLTGIALFTSSFMIISAFTFTSVLVVNGLQYKDSKILGLAFFFLLAIFQDVVPYMLLNYIIFHVASIIFGMLYVMKKIKFFAHERKKFKTVNKVKGKIEEVNF